MLRQALYSLPGMDLAEFGNITSVVSSRAAVRSRCVSEQHLNGHRSRVMASAQHLALASPCTKTIVGSLLGIAIERGLVPGVEAKLTWLLECETGEAEKDAITLRDLLTMSSCLDCNDWNAASAGNEERMYPTDDWVGFALGLPVRELRSFSYCTAGVVCLGVALERALGESLPDFAARELFAPLGIDRWRWPQTPRGESSAAGGLELTSRALHDLGRRTWNADSFRSPGSSTRWLRRSASTRRRSTDTCGGSVRSADTAPCT